MEALIGLVLLMVCPILMGLIAWMTFQQQREQLGLQNTKISLSQDLKRVMLSCFNPKLIAIIAIAGLGLYLYAPAIFFYYAPWLLITSCLASLSLTIWNLYRQRSLPKSKLTKSLRIFDHE